MNISYEKVAEEVLYELWYEYAESLLERVIKICDLGPEKAEILRQLYLRPNDFSVEIV
jgi:hypothetical protein